MKTTAATQAGARLEGTSEAAALRVRRPRDFASQCVPFMVNHCLQSIDLMDKPMKTDVFQAKKSGSSSDPLPLEIDQAEIALRQADIARLFGITRQRVSQLVSRGQLTTRPDGRINPSTAAAELLKSDAPQARGKILVGIRRQIERAEGERDQAQAAAAKASRSLARLRGRLVTVTRKLMEAERRIDVLIEEIELMLDDETRDEEIMDALGRAFDRAASTSDAALFKHLVESDEDLAALVAALRPDLAPPPPPALCEAITEALEGEPLPLLADLDEPPALEIEP